MDIAIITKKTLLASTEIFKFPNYNIYRKNGSPITINKSRGGAAYKNISAENIPQSTSPSIEFISIKLKIILTLIIGIVYVPLKTKINQTDLDNIIHSSSRSSILPCGV